MIHARINTFSILQLHEKIVRREISATEIARDFLRTIEEKEKVLNAFITSTPELALEKAKEIDEIIAKGGEVPLLAGIPCAIKDSILVEGVRCTAGSKILEGYVAPYDAAVTKKLRKEGVLLVGKTNLDEFNMGASTEYSAFGVTRNPHDLSRVAGGSSGGSAACVAAGEALVSLGADTGGSIRLPAAFCGVAGLKPTYGTVSRYGLIAMASSLDQIGPIANTVQDAEILFQAICGRDEYDATSLFYTYEPLAEFDLKKMRVGIPKEFFGEGLAPEVKDCLEVWKERLERAGVEVLDIDLPYAPYALAVYYILNTSEVSSNLARFDGVRYGQSQHDKRRDRYEQTRGIYLGAEVKRRIMLGTYALSAGYYEAYYLRAQKIRSLLQRDFQAAFARVDVLIGPVSPFLPFPIGERIRDPLAMYLVDLYAVPVNLVGLPALSLPIGFVPQNGNLPVGMQIIGKPLSENLLFAVGREFERLREE